jgi:hypothetical protein
MSSTDERVQIIEDKLNDVSQRVQKLEEGINEFKSAFKDVGVVEKETISTPMPTPDVKEWVTNKEIKFKDKYDSRVTLSFDRIMKLLNEKIRKRDTTKSWGLIQSNLNGANSIDKVNKVIQDNELKFYNNLIMGGRRTRRMRKSHITKRRLKNKKNYKSSSHKKRN